MPKYYNPYTNRYEEVYPGEDYTSDSPGYGTGKGYIKAYKRQIPREIEASKEERFQKDLARYDIEARRYQDELTRSFRQATDVNMALQQRGVQATTNQFLQRRGIDTTRGGLGASLQQSTQTQLAGQGLAANLTFSAQLASVMQQQRDAFVNREFDFFRRIDLMGYEAQIQKDLMRFQQQLQSDLSFRDTFLGVLGLAGQVVGSLIGGPVGAVVGSSATGGLTQSDQFQYQYGV